MKQYELKLIWDRVNSKISTHRTEHTNFLDRDPERNFDSNLSKRTVHTSYKVHGSQNNK